MQDPFLLSEADYVEYIGKQLDEAAKKHPMSANTKALSFTANLTAYREAKAIRETTETK